MIFPRRLSTFSSALEYSLLDWWRGCNVRSQGDGTADDMKTIQSNTQQDDAILEKYGIISNDSGRHAIMCYTERTKRQSGLKLW